MNRIEIRRLKSHYGERWVVMRHNTRNQDKWLLLEDAALIRDLEPGSVLALGCLGEMYQGIVPDLDLEPRRTYQNILMINNIEFKYLDLESLLARHIDAARHLVPGGQIISTLNLRHLIYDRVNVTIESLFAPWRLHPVLRLETLRVMLDHSRACCGDIWLKMRHA